MRQKPQLQHSSRIWKPQNMDGSHWQVCWEAGNRQLSG